MRMRGRMGIAKKDLFIPRRLPLCARNDIGSNNLGTMPII
jgi:hypothetical protein